jgi:hypothetical protein
MGKRIYNLEYFKNWAISKGERIVTYILTTNCIQFERQKKFNDCLGKNKNYYLIFICQNITF